MKEKPLIDWNRLTKKPPLEFKENPTKEDLEYLIHEVGLLLKEIAEFYGKSTVTIGKLKKKFNITQTQEEINTANRRICYEKYGVDNPAQLKFTRDKYKSTCLKRYGKDNFFSTEVGKEKVKLGNLKKYGVEHNHQCTEVIDKMKKTFLKKYGHVCSLTNPDIHKKAEETCFKNYGVDNPGKSKEVQEKMKKTNLKRYGKEIYANTDEFKNYMKQNYSKYEQMKYTKKKENNTFHVSKREDEIYEWLIQKYPDTIRQYKSDVYPFSCDFYIPSLDLYIEYQGNWTHGGSPFSGDCEQLRVWKEKSKTSKFYQNAIYTWTILDVKKRDTARKNNLNWIEFFNIKDFMEWFSIV